MILDALPSPAAGQGDPQHPSTSSPLAPSRPARPSLRLRPGTRLADVPAPTTPLSLRDFEGPFAAGEYLSVLIDQEGGGKDVGKLVDTPGSDDEEEDGLDWVDQQAWVYEHIRRLPTDLVPLITSLLASCTPETCPDMRAGEWQYLCAAHSGRMITECCAIDYILHTLDSATATLNSPQVFPSRLSIAPDTFPHLCNLARRLSRIFGHAYHHHREDFETFEEATSVWRRFLALIETYELVAAKELSIPSKNYSLAPGRGSSSEPEALGRPSVIEPSPVDGEDEDEGDWEPRSRSSVGIIAEFSIGEGEEGDDHADEEEVPESKQSKRESAPTPATSVLISPANGSADGSPHPLPTSPAKGMESSPPPALSTIVTAPSPTSSLIASPPKPVTIPAPSPSSTLSPSASPSSSPGTSPSTSPSSSSMPFKSRSLRIKPRTSMNALSPTSVTSATATSSHSSVKPGLSLGRSGSARLLKQLASATADGDFDPVVEKEELSIP